MIVSLNALDKHVIIKGFNSFGELAETDKDSSFSRPYIAFMYVLKMLAYSDLIRSGEFSEEVLEQHMEEFEAIYEHVVAVEHFEDDKIESRLDEIMEAEEFAASYKALIPGLIREIMRVFASGAVAGSEGNVKVMSKSSTRFLGSMA